MNKDIENIFFAPYKFGGLVNWCIKVLQKLNNLEVKPQEKPLPDAWLFQYTKVEPNRIIERYDKYYSSFSVDALIDEIESNLYSLQSTRDKENYAYTLIEPFKYLSNLLYPEFSTNDQSTDLTPMPINRLNTISEWFLNTAYKERLSEDTQPIEYVFSEFARIMDYFACRIAAILLTHQIDLMKLQEDIKICLKKSVNINDMYIYIGSKELTQKYIDELKEAKESKENNLSQVETKNNKRNSENTPSESLLDYIIQSKKDNFIELFRGAIKSSISTGKEKAAITFIIFESSLIRSAKRKSWKPFYSQFCKDIGWEEKSYKPNALEGTACRLKKSYYWIDNIK